MRPRPIRALRELDRRLDEMAAADRVAEEWARFELARSASRFSRRATEVVDSTMSLSATLMRAGEVDEANRLMKEAENEVRTEKAALIETVNEVKVAEQVRKKRLTRLKFAKMLATAFLSSGMFIFSAFGVVMARYFVSDDPSVQRPSALGSQNGATLIPPKQLHHIEVVPGVSLVLTGSELRQYKKMTKQGDTIELIAFLEDRLPSNIVDRVQAVLIAAVSNVDLPDVGSAKLVAEADEASEASPEASSEPSASASPEENQSSEPADDSAASPEPSPNSSPDGEDDGKGGDGDGGEGTELGGVEIPPVDPGK